MLLSLCPSTAVAASCGWDQTPGWVTRENQLKGDKHWDADVPLRFSADYSRRKNLARIEGYLNTTSAECNEKVVLTVLGSKNFSVEIYRVGYYNGAGARLVSTLKSPRVILVDSKMVPGQYLLKLSSKNRKSSFVPLTVKGSVSHEMTFVSSVLTWQSYNQWGGASLYKGPNGKSDTKASKVTFNRPYDGDGSGQFRYMEQPLVTLAEKLGIDTNYMTDIDINNSAKILSESRSIVLGGHSEYWTALMRQRYDDAVASGKNLIVFGGNTGYALTEIKSRTISGRTPYRELNNPESLLLGSQYFALGIRKDLVSNGVWPFSVLGENAIIKGIYGYEADTSMGTKGPGVQVLARAAISPTEKGFVAMSTYYKATSNAAVLNMGTNGWVCAIANRCPWGYTPDRFSQLQVQKVTQSVLQMVKTSKWPVPQIEIPSRF